MICEATYLIMVFYQLVRSWVLIGVHEVPKNDRFLHHNIIKGSAEVLVHFGLEKFLKPSAVLIIDQTVSKHPGTLVIPQSQQVCD